MKTISFTCIFLVGVLQIYAQDSLFLNNGQILKVSVIEKTRSSINYKIDSSNNSDSTCKIKISKLKKVHYQNGEIDELSSQNPRSIFPLGVSLGIMPSPHD
ncbi:MAG: hypothetical protein ACOYM7_08290, partial [Paludibacter sp.]